MKLLNTCDWDHVIWDFNGTILNDVESGIAAVNVLLKERDLPMLESVDAYRRVFGFPIRTYYERLGFDFSQEPYEVLAPQWVEQYLLQVQHAAAFDDVEETVAFFRAEGIRQTVLSATEREMLCAQLKELRLLDHFDEIMGLDNIHAASKLHLAQEWRSRHPDARVLLIGDTDHDAETASAMGADCVLIARGHQSAERLASLGVPIFTNLKAMRTILWGR